MRSATDVTVAELVQWVFKSHCIREASYVKGTFRYGKDVTAAVAEATCGQVDTDVASLIWYLTASGEGTDICISMADK